MAEKSTKELPVAEKPKRKPPNAGIGRKKGVPNKNTTLLKDAILMAAEQAGGPEKLVGYLKRQAIENPGPFLALLGKVLPTQLAVEGDIRITRVDVNFVGDDPEGGET